MDSNQTASDAKVMNSTAVISKENTSHSTEDIITKETPNNLSGYNLDKVLLLFKNVLKCYILKFSILVKIKCIQFK